jgi:hypothetical protein
MKKLLSASIAAATIAGFAAPAAAVEGLSANAGMVSDYYYRAVNLGDAGAYAGVDYEAGGFYVGTWAIQDASVGLEYDLYLGYGMSSDDFSWSVGLTDYEYDYTSDNEVELNLGLGFGAFALDVAVGEETDVAANGDDVDQDYVYVSLGWSGEVFGATVGYADFDESDDNAGDEADWTYLEVSASGEVAGLDAGITLGRVIDSSSGGVDAVPAVTKLEGSGDFYMFLDVSKSFDL